MTDVFLDTGHVVALADRRDAHHAKARALATQASEQGAQVVTTQSVLIEIGNVLSSVQRRPFAVQYIEAVRRAPAFEVVPLSEALFQRGFALFRK